MLRLPLGNESVVAALILLLACEPGSVRRAPANGSQGPSSSTVECGGGPWGPYAERDPALFVAADGAPEGDGSRSAPFATLEQALARWSGAEDGPVILGEGQHSGGQILGPEHAGIELLGACRQGVALLGSGSNPVLSVQLDDEDPITIQGLRIREGGTGLLLESGAARMEEIAIEDTSGPGIEVRPEADLVLREAHLIRNGDAGLYVEGRRRKSSDPVVTLDAIEVRDAWTEGQPAVGIWIASSRGRVEIRDTSIEGMEAIGLVSEDSGELVATNLQLRDVAGMGFWASGPHVDLRIVDSYVDRVHPSHYGTSALGHGAYAAYGAQITLIDSTIQRAALVGALAVEAAEIRIEGGEVSGTGDLPLLDSYPAPALGAFADGRMEVSGTLIKENLGGGIQAGQPESEGTEASASEVRLSEVCLLDNHIAGILVAGPLARVLLEDSSITGTRAGQPVAGFEPRGGGDPAAILLSGSGVIEIRGSQIAENEERGLMITGDGSVHTSTLGTELADWDAIQALCGVDAAGDCPYPAIALVDGLDILDTRPDPGGLFGRPISVRDTAILAIRNSEIDVGREVGLLNMGGAVRALDMTIRDIQRGTLARIANGIAVQGEDAFFWGQNIRVEGVEGPGLQVFDGSLYCEGCAVHSAAFAGLASTGGSLTFLGGEVQGIEADANLGGGFGVFSQEGAEGVRSRLILSESMVLDTELAAVYLRGNTSLLAEWNILEAGRPRSLGESGRLHGSHLVAIGGTGRRNDLLFNYNTLTGSVDVAIFLHATTGLFIEDLADDADALIHWQDCEGIEDRPYLQVMDEELPISCGGLLRYLETYFDLYYPPGDPED